MAQKYLKLNTVILTVCIVIFMICTLNVFAKNDGVDAENLTEKLQIIFSGGEGTADISDDSIYTFTSVAGGSAVSIKSEEKMNGIYIMWNKIPGKWSYTANGHTYTAGEKGFLHEYVKLEQESSEIIITIPDEGAQITDIYAFSEGILPEWVQVWEEPCEYADILLFSTHSDDEQLFFAGMLPYYAIERQAYVQVVYMTNHWDTTTRPHEQLNGLWTVGIKNYPVISEFPDDARSLGQTSESRETVLARAQSVYSEEEWIKFQVQLIRKFKPQVVVGHDLNGEYRHGAHILNTNALMTAIEVSNDEKYDTVSAEQYGTWNVAKTYFHLYDDNKIIMDWDTPYDSMDGRTPFEISKLGYACHYSQQWTWFTDWISKEKAADIETYNPCQYGLYRTLAGEDVEKNDMLENITPWAEIIAQQEAERIEKEEEERRKAEEEARKNEQSQTSDSSNLESDSLNADENNENILKKFIKIAAVIMAVMVIIVIIIIIVADNRAKKRRRRRKKYRGRR